MSKKTCPICGKKIVGGLEAAAAKYYPFCSERCQLVDLGHWFEGEYRIPSRSQEESPEEEPEDEET